VLHAFERGQKLFTPPRRLLAGKQVGEELRCIAHLLGLDAELVALPRREAGELLAPLADLAESPRQLLGGGGLDRHVAVIAHEIVWRLRPLSGLEPSGDVERQATKPRRAYRLLGARERLGALPSEIAREARDALQPRMPPPHRRDHPRHQHLELARRPEL